MYDVARARYGWLISEEDFEPRLAFLGGDLPAINLERMPWESVAAKVTCDVVDCRELADGMGAEFDEIEAAKGGAREPEYVTAGELAEMFGGTVGAARKRLDRYAKDNGDAVRSLLDAGSREPQRLYVFSKVKHLFATG